MLDSKLFTSTVSRLDDCIQNTSGDKCLTQAVEIIAEQLGLVFVGVYVTDTAKTWAIFRAGSGKAGKALLEHKHKLAIDKDTKFAVGQSIFTNTIRIVEQMPLRDRPPTIFEPDLGERVSNELGAELHFISAKPVRFWSPLIVARWQLVCPLRKAEQTLGALEVYTDQVNDFVADDFIYLQRLADRMTALVEVATSAQTQAGSSETR